MIAVKRYKIRQFDKFTENFNTVKFAVFLCLFGLLILLSACSELEQPKTEEFYATTTPPVIQEFRWSNGKMPQSFDPALASAPPETDIVRAIFDGLTETEPKSLKAIPSIAYKWTDADDSKKWTFNLRQDAKWSNGKTVTADDFVRSWKRLAEMGETAPHFELLNNIVGLGVKSDSVKDSKTDIFSLRETAKSLESIKRDIVRNNPQNKSRSEQNNETSENSKIPDNDKKTVAETNEKQKVEAEIGLKAIDEFTLEISLIKSDKEFPNLVAHPAFRPIYSSGEEFGGKQLNADVVTNGAFRIASVGDDGVTLERNENYYNKENIKLKRVRFVPIDNADSALEAYRKGEIDAVTNAEFEPLALKILTPFEDFKRGTHSALNFYEFNRKKEPFNDRRVRQALAISIDRERLTKDEMEGATEPAYSFSASDDENLKSKISENPSKGKDLMTTAGFPDGQGFPVVKLVVNRNNVQQRIAKSVAKMWKQNLNIETEIIVKEFDELETSKNEGQYDLIRRGVVLPTSDETANMLAIFAPTKTLKAKEAEMLKSENTIQLNDLLNGDNANVKMTENPDSNESNSNSVTATPLFENELLIDTGIDNKIILTEEVAINEVPAIPLYFPMTYSLVKPYVKGFEMNTLDAPLLKDVYIDNNWQPENSVGKN